MAEMTFWGGVAKHFRQIFIFGLRAIDSESLTLLCRQRVCNIFDEMAIVRKFRAPNDKKEIIKCRLKLNWNYNSNYAA